jgi:hypothetical protein
MGEMAPSRPVRLLYCNTTRCRAGSDAAVKAVASVRRIISLRLAPSRRHPGPVRYQRPCAERKPFTRDNNMSRSVRSPDSLGGGSADSAVFDTVRSGAMAATLKRRLISDDPVLQSRKIPRWRRLREPRGHTAIMTPRSTVARRGMPGGRRATRLPSRLTTSGTREVSPSLSEMPRSVLRPRSRPASRRRAAPWR